MASGAVKIPQLNWDEIRPSSVVLLTGPEEFLADRAVSKLREMLHAEDAGLEVSDISADDYLVGTLATLASPSLFGEPRLIRVSKVEKCTDEFLDEVLNYLANPEISCTLSLRHAGGKRAEKLLTAIRGGLGAGVEVLCPELKRDSDKISFVNSEFRNSGVQIDAASVRSLVSAFSGDLAELAAACRQLASDSPQGVTLNVVDQYYGGRVEANAFRVADAAIAGNRAEALVLLRNALETGSDPVPIVAAFASKLRTMARVSGAYGSDASIARELGLAPWQVERAKRDLRGWSQAGLAQSIKSIASTDANVKGAGADPLYALEQMIIKVSARGA
ncbi:MAG: DNA polymerase III subunit delta [Cryobacterium sp.]|nr:DNA polymerase III subunit delta [Cryobacterium sp.]